MRVRASSSAAHLGHERSHGPPAQKWEPIRRRRRGRTSRLTVIVTASCLLIGGCTSSQQDTADGAAETSPAVEEETGTGTQPTWTLPEAPTDMTTLTVTFDGEGCSYPGPSQLPPGTVILEFVDDSDGHSDMRMTMTRLEDGVTYEDVTAFYSPEPYEGNPPEDLFETEQADYTVGGGTDERPGWITAELETGEYAMVCFEFIPWSDGPDWVARPGGVSVTE